MDDRVLEFHYTNEFIRDVLLVYEFGLFLTVTNELPIFQRNHLVRLQQTITLQISDRGTDLHSLFNRAFAAFLVFFFTFRITLIVTNMMFCTRKLA